MDFPEIQNDIIRKVLQTDDIDLLNQIRELLDDVHSEDGKHKNKNDHQNSDEDEETYHKVTELKANDSVFREISKLI